MVIIYKSVTVNVYMSLTVPKNTEEKPMRNRLIGAVTVIALLAGSVGGIFPFGGDLKQARAARRPETLTTSQDLLH